MKTSSTLRKVKKNKHLIRVLFSFFKTCTNLFQNYSINSTLHFRAVCRFRKVAKHLPRPEICFENTVVTTTKVERTKYQRIIDFITMLDFAAIEQVQNE